MDDASQNGDTDTYNTLQEQMEAVNKKLAEVDTASSCRRYRQKESRSPGRHKKYPEQSRA